MIHTRKFLNRWSLMGLILLSALGTAIYVNSVMKINAVLGEIRVLEKKRDSLMIINQSIQAKVFELQSASRITSIAKKKLGMISNPKAPQIVDIPSIFSSGKIISYPCTIQKKIKED